MDLASLKKSRTARRTNIDKLIVEIKQSIVDNKADEVEVQLAKLEVKEHDLFVVTAELEAQTPTSDVEAEVAANDDYRDVIIDIKVRANRFLKQQKAIAAAVAAIPAQVGATNTTKVTAKLPKLQIPKFDGNLLDFERFWAQFSSGVDLNTTLTKVDKFNYLLSLLTEKARLTIKGLSLTDSNYDLAIKLIKDKYGKPELLVEEHIQQLWRCKRVTQVGNGQELRQLYEEFQSHIHSLDTLGKDTIAMGPILCHILRKNLPRSLLIEWNRKTLGASTDNLHLLMDFVRCELEGIEAACRYVAEVTKEVSNKKDNTYSQTSRTSSALVATNPSGNSNQQRFSSNPQQSVMPYCYFCDDRTHYSGSCPVYTTNQARKDCLAQAKRCFRCFKRSHQSRNCEQKIICKYCSKPHHTLLCNLREAQASRGSQGNPANNSQTNSSSNKTNASNRKQETTAAVVTKGSEEPQTLVASSSSTRSKGSQQVSVLQTMRVWIRHGRSAQQVTLLVDGGAERSFILERTVKRLGLKTRGTEETTIRSFGGHKTQQVASLVDFVLEGYNGVQLPVTALQVNTICQGVKLWESSLIEKYLQDKRIYTWNQKMGPGELVDIEVLIVADFYWLVMNGHMKRLSDKLMATQSIFGWMIQGSVEAHAPVKPIVTMCATQESIHTSEPTTQQQLSQLWEMDQSGIMEQENKSPLQLQDVEVLQRFEETITFQEQRYQVRIPWRENKDKLASNFEVAKERLRKMLWRLSKDPALYERYKNGVFEYLKNGHAEEVSLTQHNKPLFYLPHHAVIKEDRKTTKVRIVFDGSSCQEGEESLNTCQDTGPSLNPPIFNLLLRFRWEAVAMVSDITKAFLQILLHPDDRDAVRFLWTDKPWKKDQEPQFQVFRMSRVLFGMKSSPFLLAATIRFHVKTHPDSTPELSKYVDERIYVDDMLSGSRNSHTAHTLFKHIHSLFLKAGMELTKWVTNDATLRQQWVEEGITSKTDTIELLKVLGLLWDPITDNFSIRTISILEALGKEPNTKRSMLRILASIFDPLGFLSPITITVKKMLQDLWKLKIGWDQDIPEGILEDWQVWKNELPQLTQLQIPRWLRTDNHEHYQLHVFCDAGPRVYATVVYIRFQENTGKWHSQLITSKSRLAPTSLMSIPRLELMACLIGSRLALSIQQTYTHVKFAIQFWSDSKVALQWISDVPSRWKLFVGRRVQEIQANTTENCKWSYCPSKNNIADLQTRGQELTKLIKNQEWWYGPHWLRLAEEDWQFHECNISEKEEQNILQEEETNEVSAHLVAIIPRSSIIPEDYYSTWQKLVRVTAWILRFVNNCRKLEYNNQKFLSYKELKAAEFYWFAYIQTQQFPEEIRLLQNKQELSKNSAIQQFQPFLDSKQILRLGGRLQFSDLNTNQQHPIFLRPGGLVELLIQDRHCKTLHGGTQATLAKLRDEVWILRGRQTVRKAIHGCRVCRKWRAKPANEIEAQLPAVRVRQAIPFHNTGVDFAGPLEIREGKNKTKAYICLFTCAVTRAIHLELVSTQSLQHFLLAFRRFFARRGGCKFIYSDNAGTYHQTDKLLRESYGHLYSTQTQELAAQFGIEWRFISPRASWWGGFYERLVQSVKFHLRRSLGTALLNAEELSTLLVEIEAVINNRPLFTLSEDPQDDAYLTPSHFLLGKTADNLCDNLDYILEASVKKQLYRRWQYRKQLMNRFWKSWRHDYLLQLRTAHTVKASAANQEPVKLNDVVLICEDKLPRGQWKIAKVIELTPGRDGKIRSVMLQLPNKSLIRRAVQHICPLEVL